ncbi:hypothetical protein I4U23_011594 [Adineta vaga]|nr:hypothetical protein I4U23_011594 [Adineta vaga]
MAQYKISNRRSMWDVDDLNSMALETQSRKSTARSSQITINTDILETIPSRLAKRRKRRRLALIILGTAAAIIIGICIIAASVAVPIILLKKDASSDSAKISIIYTAFIFA